MSEMPSEEEEAYQAKVNSLEADIVNLKDDVSALEEDNKDLSREVNELRSYIIDVVGHIEDAERARGRGRLDELEKALDTLISNIKSAP